MKRTLMRSAALVVAFFGLSVVVVAQQLGGGTTVRVPEGETRQGDLYAGGELVEIAGRLEGDLIAGAQRIRVTGPVTGDIFAAGRTVDIRGPVGDSTRAAAEQVTVSSTIDGDLVVAGNRCQVLDGAHVTGGVLAGCATVQLDGTVDGTVRTGGGEVIVTGTIGGDAIIRADRLSLAPTAQIVGQLDYESRTPLTPEEEARVGGAINFDEIVDDEDDSGSAAGSFLFWGWQTGAALLAGLIAVALFRRVIPRAVSAIAENTTVGALLGFAAFLMVPAGAIIIMITVIGVPVGVLSILLFLVALYVAKLPIAAWAGGQLLARAGMAEASPYLAMALGVVVLYVLFALPYVGWLIWLGATWLGLGAMVLGVRGNWQPEEA